MAAQNMGFLTPELQAEQLGIDRKRRLAEALLAQGMQQQPQGQMVGRFYVPSSPLQGLSRALAMHLGMRGNEQADQASIDLQRRGAQARQDALTALGANPNPQAMLASQDPQIQNIGLQQMLAEPQRVDLGDRIGLMKGGQIVGYLPKAPTPDATLRQAGEDRRHATPSGSAVLGADTTRRGQDLVDRRTREEGAANRGVTVRGQDLVDQRTREQMERDKFGAPVEVTGPTGPTLVMQNKGSGQLVDANTRQPIGPVGPKLGESAQKQQTGVQNVKGAITEYRDALKTFDVTDLANPNARARMGTVYNNMLLQAKEAYNLGVLNGPDYMILQEVITNPASWTGAITSKKALDDQAKKLDELMSKVGDTVTSVQSGQTPQRRKTDDPLGLRPR